MSKLKNDKVNVELNIAINKTQANQTNAEIHRLTKSTEELRRQNAESREEISRLKAAEGDYSQEIKRLKDTIKANNEVIKENNRQITLNKTKIQDQTKEVDLSRLSAAQLGKVLKSLKRELNNTARAVDPSRYRDLEAAISRTEVALAKAQRTSKSFRASFLSLDKAATAVKGFFLGIAAVITTQVIGAFKNAVSTIIEFERENSRLAAILGTTKKGIAGLMDEARRLGATTSYTAAQVTQLQIELAKLGFSQQQITDMEAGVLKFAKAVGTDLASAAAFAGASMRIFNISADKTDDMLATLAISTTKSALDFSYLQSAMSTVGPVAKSFGFSIQETVALLGALANAGFDASTAATATRNILLNLADSSGALATALGGKVSNLDELTAGMKKLKDEGVDLAKALELTDKRSVAVFSSFLNNIDTLTDLRDSVTDAGAAFSAMSNEMGNNVDGELKVLSSTVEGVILKFYSATGPLRTLVQAVTKLVEAFGKLIDFMDRHAKAIKVATVAFLSYRAGIILTTAAKAAMTKVSKALYKTSLQELVLMKAKTAAMAVWRSALLLGVAAKEFFTGNTLRAAAAMRIFNATVKANPLGLLLSVIGAVVAAIELFVNKTDKAAVATDHWADAIKRSGELYGQQRAKIETLIMVAENERISLGRRRKAVQELNRIIPGYNAQIDATTLKYRASTTALNEYLNGLEREMRYKAHTDELQKLIGEAEKLRGEADAAGEALAEANQKHWDYIRRREAAGKRQRTYADSVAQKEARKDFNTAKAAADAADAAVDAYKKKIEQRIKEGSLVPDSVVEDAVEESLTKPATEAADKAVGEISNLDAQIQKLKKELKSETDDNVIKDLTRQISELQKKRKELLGKSSAKATRQYADESLKAVEAPIKQDHNARQLAIEQQKAAMSTAEYQKRTAKELKQFYSEQLAAFEAFAAGIPETHTATLDKIREKTDAAQSGLFQAAEQERKAMVDIRQQEFADQLNVFAAFHEAEEDEIRRRAAQGELDSEASELYIQEIKRRSVKVQLDLYRNYFEQVKKDESLTVEERARMEQQLADKIRQLQNRELTDAGKFMETLRNLLAKNPDSLAGIEETYAQRRAAMVQTYDAAIAMAGENSEAAVDLERAKNEKLAQLDEEHRRKMSEGYKVFGDSLIDQRNKELDDIKKLYGDEEKYAAQKAKAIAAVKMKYAMQYAQKFIQLSGDMISAVQDAEIAASDAKYDVLIRQAENNGEDTAALEEEKENKKLEIQKKYADVNFAIKAGEIVANTAVAIMQAFSQMGPIAGAIAAVLLTATGAAQLAQANVERQKIKNMQPSRTSSSSNIDTQSTKSVERVMTGYSEGGYTGPGDRYEVAGLVHRGEYVVPKPIMTDPRVIDAVGTIEAIRLHRARGLQPQPVAGYAEGGYVQSEPGNISFPELTEAVRDLKDAAKNIKAYVLYTDIEDAENALERARKPFTK